MYILLKTHKCIYIIKSNNHNLFIFYFEQVAVHLSKLFDNMSDLDFSNSEELDNPKRAVGMYSKEREYVSFMADCRCEGPVSIVCKTKSMFYFN